MAIVALLVGSCLNPIDFNPNNFKLNVNVSGSIKIDDVAVMWLINRTKTVDVTQFTISRDKMPDESDEQYNYPKSFTGKPAHGESLASYHAPSENTYAITVVWQNPDNPDENGVIGPVNVQFPRAQDYKYYLYRTLEGKIVLVNEDKMKELPPNPDDNYPDPQPSSVNAQSLVVLNITPDQNIDNVEFSRKPSTYMISGRPKAKDQEMILLGSGSYEAKISYTRGGIQFESPVKTVVVTKEDGSMAVRTNFLYFYKTTGGGYDLTQYWPPLANDAASENSPEDAMLDTQGILEIHNNAVPNNPHALVARININGTEYPDSVNTSNYFAPGDAPLRFILPVGPVSISFRPVDQPYYGQVSARTIQAKKVTKLSYINDLGDPFVFPNDTGNGSGLIRIINNSTAVVTSAAVYDKDDVSKFLSMGYESFNPPQPVNYGKVGLVPVVGTADVPLKSGATQLIQVVLETAEGVVVIERLGALRGQIVEITISQVDLNPGGNSQGGRYGSKVIVRNQTTTPTAILGAYVYNKDNAAAMAVYPLDIQSPPNSEASLYVLSTVGLPIMNGAHYGARLIVHGNGLTGVIDKEFTSDDELYSGTPDSHVRYLSLEQKDLPAALVQAFVPVTDITISPSPYELVSITESGLDGKNASLRLGGALNLNHAVTVSPAGATKKSPIVWTLKSGATGFVSLDANGVLTVTGVADPSNSTVTLGALIEKADGDWTAFTDISRDITIRLIYRNTVRTQKVTGISLTASPAVEVEEGHTLDLKSLAALNPPLANINGVPITADDLTWAIISPTSSTGSTVSGTTFTAGTRGNVTIRAVLPANKNDGSSVSASTIIHVVRAAQPFIPVTGMTTGSGPLVLPYYTQTDATGIKTLAGTVQQINLNAYTVINPSNATVQSPISWQILSTNAPANTVEIKNDQWLSVTGIAGNNNTVRVKASIPKAGTGSQDFSAEFTVTLQEHNSRLVGQGELVIAPASVQIGKTIDLNTLVTLPRDAYVDVADPLVSKGAITTADLTWEFVSSSSSILATLSGSQLTGTSAGTVNIKATLPAAKNGQLIGGTAITARGVITITTPPPAYPQQFTLRLIKTGGSDSVVQIALVPVSGNPHNLATSRTGHTKIPWAHQFLHNGVDPSHRDSFMRWLTRYKGVKIISIANFAKVKDWVDVTIDWPTGSATGYYLFFIEGDNRVRGYANPGTLDPAKDKNFLFYLRPDYLYDNYRLSMGTTKANGNKQVNSLTTPHHRVIPIGYDSWNNTASIMKPMGVDNQPSHDLSDF
jgi:hypothetical protein